MKKQKCQACGRYDNFHSHKGKKLCDDCYDKACDAELEEILKSESDSDMPYWEQPDYYR